jgi:hypothetical protein
VTVSAQSEIEAHPIPSVVYHYTTQSAALEGILQSGHIRLSSLGKTNDPRESKEWGFPTSFSGVIDHDRMMAIYQDLASEANKMRSQEWWVLCVGCNDPTLVEPQTNERDRTHFMRGYARARMWAHYAQSHRGVCLEFDGVSLHDSISLASSSHALMSGPVIYRDEFERTGTRDRDLSFQFDYSKLSVGDVSQNVRAHIRANYRHYFLEKSPEWSSEHEYRWLLNKSGDGIEVDISSSLRSVIAGVDFSEVYAPSLRALCKRFSARMDRMNWFNRKPSRGEWK